MENCPDCHAPDWRLGPAHPVRSHRVAGGSGASHRACLHRQDLPSVSTAPSRPPRSWKAWHWGASAWASTCSAASPRCGKKGACRSAASSGICADPSISCACRVGAIVSAIHQTAQQAQPAVAGLVDRIRASPVVHADETGWRQNGNNGYVWTFSTPTERLLPAAGSGQGGPGGRLRDWASPFSGVLVSDFYAAYHHYDGPKQRCWAHLLRDIHDLVALYPKDTSLAQWAAAVHQLSCRGQVFHPSSGCTTTAHRSTGLGAAAAGHRPALPG